MYIVEGNIGAGKSTFLKLLAQHVPHVSVVQEPVYDWQNKIYGQSLLENFYQQPQRWAYTFETLTMMCRVKEHMHLQETPATTLICERSIYSGFYCFAQNSFDSGFLTQLEWSMYCDWFSFLVPNNCIKPQGFIYLQADPTICYERVKKRSRSAEDTISLEYISQIHRRHEEFLLTHRDQFNAVAHVPVLVLDVSQEFEGDMVHFANLSKQLQEFIIATQTEKTPAKQLHIQHVTR